MHDIMAQVNKSLSESKAFVPFRDVAKSCKNMLLAKFAMASNKAFCYRDPAFRHLHTRYGLTKWSQVPAMP